MSKKSPNYLSRTFGNTTIALGLLMTAGGIFGAVVNADPTPTEKAARATMADIDQRLVGLQGEPATIASLEARRDEAADVAFDEQLDRNLYFELSGILTLGGIVITGIGSIQNTYVKSERE